MEARAFVGTKIDPSMIPHGFSRRNLFRVSCSVQTSPSSHNLRLRDTSLSKSHAKSFKLKAKSSEVESTRPLAKFPPSIWGDRFLSVPSTDKLELDALKTEIEELEPKVRDMLISSHTNDKEKIRLIHLVINLGLSYHFENEMEETLKHAYGNLREMIADEHDLYTISIMFQVFRLYGHNMSCDVFERFKGDDGEFKKSLESDARAMLSLYEASYLGTTTEVIMDEAMRFTKNYLDSIAATDQTSPHLHLLIKNTLRQNRHRNMEILAFKEYISFYDQEVGDRDEILLKFAKLNFKYLQLHYIQELETVSKWWKDQDLASKLPFFRDRIVESYFFALGMYVEPQYSFERITMTKLLIMSTVVDDSCDAYGTLPEIAGLAGLVHSVDSVDLGVIEKFGIIELLPNYLKIMAKHSLQLLQEIERADKPQNASYVKQHIMDEAKLSMGAILRIEKWAREGHVPTLEEYMECALFTSGVYMITTFIVACMEDIEHERILKWLRSRPKIIDTINSMFRFSNDKASYKHETSRGEGVNGINCYTKQFGVTEEEAVGAIQEMYDYNYKILMEELLKTRDVPRKLLSRFRNAVRVTDVLYKDGDGFTYPRGNSIERHITSLFIDRIQI